MWRTAKAKAEEKGEDPAAMEDRRPSDWSAVVKAITRKAMADFGEQVAKMNSAREKRMAKAIAAADTPGRALVHVGF